MAHTVTRRSILREQVWTEEGRQVLSAIDQLPEPAPLMEVAGSEQGSRPASALEEEGNASQFVSNSIADPKKGTSLRGFCPRSTWDAAQHGHCPSFPKYIGRYRTRH